MDWQIYKKVFYFGRTLFYGPTQPSLLSTNPWSSVSTLSAQLRLPHRVRSGCSQKKLADELILGVPVGLAFRWHSTVLNVTIVIL